ncbi:MAG: PD-(D/E)XK nuclease family protein [Candidatus Thermoplasmatota archaeon]|nr:PD-(D/E)XK nuclease family protein [Candidatus Thermoplasmatota archaeon]
MTVYSHSKLSCFEQCPYRYKLNYIDKVETEIEETIEAFLGSRVHQTLEKLYRDLMFEKQNSLDDLIDILRKDWEKNWNDSIIIVKNEYVPENYLKMAERYITDYYKRYHPFKKDKTIALEQRILINLDEEGYYKLQGYIDRLSEVKDGFYEIHDYKTNSRLPLPEYIQNDRQLALYSIGVLDSYPDAKDVRLIWHFLKFDKEVDSTRTSDELEELKKSTIQLIDSIESEKVFLTNPSGLCSWCEFHDICKEFSHLYKVKDLPVNEFLSEDGVKLVNRYAELKAKKKQLTLDVEVEIEKIEEALISYSEKTGESVIFGSSNKVKISKSKRYTCPEKNSKKRIELEEKLKKMGKWEEVAQLDTNAINKIIQENEWEKEVIDVLLEYVELQESSRLYLSKYDLGT